IGNINEYAKFLRANPNTFIAIIGHTDLKGEKEKQVKLSIQRAEAVREEFARRGIDGSRIKVIGRGKSTPLWQKENYEWQAHENRRVEIAVYE
ncbi:MAG: OmpA family protein, partial [Raineya sp.]